MAYLAAFGIMVVLGGVVAGLFKWIGLFENLETN